MVILVFGKSGSGKTYLCEKLAKDLPNTIHISLDELNKDLMDLDDVKEFAKELFSENVMVEDTIDCNFILKKIKEDNEKYGKWNTFMIDKCKTFLINYMAETNFDHYLLDHINSGIWDFDKSIKIKCVLDDETRLQRLKQREDIDLETLNFRDKNYLERDCDIEYNNNNYLDVCEFIKKRKI